MTTRALLAFWLPLALSWMMMAVAQPLASVGIARLPEPHVHLAAYSATLDLAVLVESPVIMLFSAAVALVRDQRSYRMLRAFMLAFGGALTALFVLIAFTPLSDLILRGALGLPDAVATEARAALRLLVPWVPSIAWRRFYQGPLVLAGRTRLITYGTLWRLAAFAGVLAAGTRWALLPGAVLGALALAASVVVEAVAVTIWALPVVRALPARDGEPLTPRGILRFYLPLAGTDVMRVVSRPVTTAGIARAALPATSLAAWPVAHGLSGLLSSAVMAFQEVVVAVSTDEEATRRVARFVTATGLVFSAALAVVAFTPLVDLYLVHVVRLPAALLSHAVAGLRLLVLLPALLALRNLLRGILIRRRHTPEVQRAMTAYLVALAVCLAIGAWQTVPGVLLAAVAVTVAQVVEVLSLALSLQRAPVPVMEAP